MVSPRASRGYRQSDKKDSGTKCLGDYLVLSVNERKFEIKIAALVLFCLPTPLTKIWTPSPAQPHLASSPRLVRTSV